MSGPSAPDFLELFSGSTGVKSVPWLPVEVVPGCQELVLWFPVVGYRLPGVCPWLSGIIFWLPGEQLVSGSLKFSLLVIIAHHELLRSVVAQG